MKCSVIQTLVLQCLHGVHAVCRWSPSVGLCAFNELLAKYNVHLTESSHFHPPSPHPHAHTQLLSSHPSLPSQVYLGRHKVTGKFYAIKVLQKKAIVKRNEVKHIMAERNVLLMNVQHPFLVGLHYSFQTSTKLYFVLDYVNGGELFFHLQRERVFDEPRAR